MRTSSLQQSLFLDALTCQGDYHSKSPMVLYGGAGFGGKSYALRTASLELNGVLAASGFPGRWGAIFCVDYPRLMDRHGRKLDDEMSNSSGRSGTCDVGRTLLSKKYGLHFRFHDPNLGGFFLRNAKDPESYRGIEYDWILIDELTEFMRDDFDSIMYQLRSSDKLPFLSFGAATNPDGVGHGWCKRLWIDRDFSDEPAYNPENFHFIQAMAYHNPAFTEDVRTRLMSFKDPTLVKSRWEGSWDIASGVRFSTFDRNVHTITQEEFCRRFRVSNWRELAANQDSFQLYGSLDFGTDIHAASAFYLHLVTQHGVVYTVLELYMPGFTLKRQAQEILKAIGDLNVRRIYCDPSLWGKDSDGISRAHKFRECGVPLVKGNNERIEGWASMDAMLYYIRNEAGEVVESPRWLILDYCRNLISDISDAPRDDVRPEDILKRYKRDHSLDSVRYFFHSRYKGPAGPSEKAIHPRFESRNEKVSLHDFDGNIRLKDYA